MLPSAGVVDAQDCGRFEIGEVVAERRFLDFDLISVQIPDSVRTEAVDRVELRGAQNRPIGRARI